jgi:photosystem II stability/assembly factor-like uncharacterized protein
MKINFIIFRIVIFCAILIQSLTAQWLERKNGLPDTFGVLGGSVIEPIDSLTAYATVNNGKIYKTSDAGLNWIDITSPTFPSDISVEDISAIDENSIWICGFLDITSYIFASFNGGESWIEQYQSDEGNIWFIEMFSKDSGMAAGYAYSDVPVPMIQTVDSGAHWIEKNHDYLIGDYGHTNGIDIVDMDMVFFQKKWWTLSRSTDGGASWDSVYTTLGGEVVSFYNRQFGLLATVWGQIYKSVDGGDTWQLISVLPVNSSNCLTFLPGNPAKIWLSIEYNLFFSEDSGYSWIEYTFEEDFWSYDIDFIDDRHGWIMAENMVYYTKTGDRIVTGIKNEPIIRIDFRLDQNYPNPFNPITLIRYSLPKSEYVKINVYNLIGQRIKTLQHKIMPAGYHEVNFNAEDLSSGIYYYRLEAGEFQDVKKMILLK